MLLRYATTCLLVIFPVCAVSGKGNVNCDSPGHKMIEGKFGEETHMLCLKLTPISPSLASHQSAIILDPETYENGEDMKSAIVKGLPLSDTKMAYGYLMTNPASGSAEGYIGEDNQFYGILHLGNKTLYADPKNQDDKGFVGAYFGDNIIGPVRTHRRVDMRDTASGSFPLFPFLLERKTRRRGVASARLCELLLLADKEYFDKDANSNLNHAVKRMMHAVAQADIIFRNTDFNEDGTPDNIGFTVKYILILASNETNSRVFGDLSGVVDGHAYLMRFARLRRLSEVCLGVAFSGHAFFNRTLGLSFTSLGGGLSGAAGGLCDRRSYGRSFNTLALAHSTSKERVPERVAAFTLAHELGHSFGAQHDDNFPNKECQGYIMSAHSTATETYAPYQFSICSKRLITATLESMSYCLIEEDEPYCGNGIVEKGEACDCGLPSLCSRRDPCCTPRAGGAAVMQEGTLHKQGCAVAPTASCHPSQGLCCMNNCQYADLSDSGIDCRTVEQSCPCNNAQCECALGGRCLKDGSCHAAECALLGLKECYCRKGPGGTLGKSNLCGVCCKLAPKQPEMEGQCAGAEFAALEALKNNQLPRGWPNMNFTGSNATLNLCTDKGCVATTIRVWTVGSRCVTMRSVGVCVRGICMPGTRTPRSNIYPESIMKLKSSSKSPIVNVVLNFFAALNLVCFK